MTITGLPFVLGNTMEAIFITHEIGNWSIFNENNGGITIKLKLQSKGQGHSNVQEVAYRKKSQQQIDRDRVRAKRRRQGSADTSSPVVIETERKMFESSLENIELDCSVVQLEKSLSECQSFVEHAFSGINEVASQMETNEVVNLNVSCESESKAKCSTATDCSPLPINAEVSKVEHLTDIEEEVETEDTEDTDDGSGTDHADSEDNKHDYYRRLIREMLSAGDSDTGQ